MFPFKILSDSLKSIVYLSWLCVISICLFPLVVLSLLHAPYSVIKRLRSLAACFIYKYIICVSNPLIGRKVHLYGDSLDLSGQRSYMLISNHTSATDIITISILLERMRLASAAKFLSKVFNMLLPVGGYGMLVCGSVPLSRRNTVFDMEMIRRSTTQAISNGDNFVYVVFPEGTRFIRSRKDIVERSNEFLMKTYHKITHHVLAPRVRGYKMLLDATCDAIAGVYDITICYTDCKRKNVDEKCISSMSVLDYFWNENVESHVYIKYWPMEDLYKLDKECHYIYQWFYEKDQLISDFWSSGKGSFSDYRETLNSFSTGSVQWWGSSYQ